MVETGFGLQSMLLLSHVRSRGRNQVLGPIPPSVGVPYYLGRLRDQFHITCPYCTLICHPVSYRLLSVAPQHPSDMSWVRASNQIRVVSSRWCK